MSTILIILCYYASGVISTLPPDAFDNAMINENTFIASHTSNEHKCLSEALYFEARGEQEKGVIAVGNVIINRKKSSRFPNTICSVIKQKKQFSYKNDGISDIPTNKKMYIKMEIIAFDVLHGRKVLPDNTLYYHNHTVKPSWAKKLVVTKIVGNHIFYKSK